MHGGGVRMFHNIRVLAKHHSVDVISFVENDDEQDLLKSVEPICNSITAVRRVPDFSPHWLSLDPFLVREFSTPEMDEAVDRTFRKKRIDVLQCEYLQMAQYRRRSAFSVLTIHETLSANAWAAFRAEADPPIKLKLFYRWMQMLRYEVIATRRFDRVVTMTDHDARYLRSYSPSAEIQNIPIGVDTQEFIPHPLQSERPFEVLFVGNFRHTPNAEAARFLVNDVAPAFPKIRFLLPGNNVPSDLQRVPNVVLPGYAADTRVLYRRPNTIVAAPLFSGTGQRVKLLEAFGMACPVITTSVGALGFPIQNGREALIANNAQEFREALDKLVASEDLRISLGLAARDMIVREFDWAEIGNRLLKLVEPPTRGRVLMFRNA
jgi:glycosyltransferase involved in cell wall biosynthesis